MVSMNLPGSLSCDMQVAGSYKACTGARFLEKGMLD